MEPCSALPRYAVGLRRYRPIGTVDGKIGGDLLDPYTQEALDRITYLAGEALEVPAVCTSLVDAEWHLLTSSYGVPVPTALLLSHAFWKHVAFSNQPLVIADGRHDPLLAHNPAIRDGTVVACMGMPLGTGDGRAVGTLLAMDRKPRRWTDLHLDLLTKLSRLIVSEMEFVAAVRRASRSDVSSEQAPSKASQLGHESVPVQ